MAGAKDKSRFTVEFAEMLRGPHKSHVQIQRQMAGPGRGHRGTRPGLSILWHLFSRWFVDGTPQAGCPRLLLSSRHFRGLLRGGFPRLELC